MTTLISLPIHERPEVVADQLENIKRFMPSSLVMIHISKGFQGDVTGLQDLISWQYQGFAFINPERLNTAWAGMIQSHLSNFKAAVDAELDFTHFAMHASNDMFVKLGAEEYIEKHGCGVQQFPCSPDMMWTPRRRATWDPQLHAIMDDIGATKMHGSQIEGTFYTKSIFEDIHGLFRKNFDVNKIEQYGTKDDNDHNNTLYAREELYFSIIASEIVRGKLARPYLFSEVMTGVKTTPVLIDQIRTNEVNDEDCVEKRICDPHYRLYDKENLYAVKRVARDLRDPLRRYIRELK